MECDVFNPSNTKAHKSFTFHCNLIKTLEEQKLKEWMVEQFSKLLKTELFEHDELVVSDDEF